MRSRLLNPDFFVNEELAALGPLAMLMFEGMWCIADREGRLEDRPGTIKARCVPFFDCNADELIQSLHDAGFIVRYEVDRKKYIEIVTFLRHQRPHERETQSVIPGRLVSPKKNVGSSKVRPRLNQGSPKTNLDSPTTYIDTDIHTETELGSETETDLKSEYPAEFEQGWQLYPPRAGSNPKREAFNAWKASLVRSSGATPAALYAAVEQYRRFCDATDTTGTKFVLQAVTFFGPSERWRETWAVPAPRGVFNGHRPEHQSLKNSPYNPERRESLAR